MCPTCINASTSPLLADCRLPCCTVLHGCSRPRAPTALQAATLCPLRQRQGGAAQRAQLMQPKWWREWEPEGQLGGVGCRGKCLLILHRLHATHKVPVDSLDLGLYRLYINSPPSHPVIIRPKRLVWWFISDKTASHMKQILLYMGTSTMAAVGLLLSGMLIVMLLKRLSEKGKKRPGLVNILRVIAEESTPCYSIQLVPVCLHSTNWPKKSTLLCWTVLGESFGLLFLSLHAKFKGSSSLVIGRITE